MISHLYSCVIEHDAGRWEALAHTVLAVLLALEPSASDQVFAGSRKHANKTVSGRFIGDLNQAPESETCF
jgi:hypothetical protein